MVLVKNTTGLTTPNVYSLEIEPLVIINGIQTGTIALLGSAKRGNYKDSIPFNSYDQDFIKEYGPVYAEGSKKDTRNYLSLPLGMIGIATQGGATVYPFRTGDFNRLDAGQAEATITSGSNSYTLKAKTPGTYFDNATLVIATDANDTATKKITVSTFDASEIEVFEQVSNFMDELERDSSLIDVDFTGTTHFLPSNGTYTFVGGDDGVDYPNIVNADFYAQYVGEEFTDGSACGLSLVEKYDNIRMIVMSEHYATWCDNNGEPLANGTYLDSATIKAIQVCESISAISIINIDDNLSFSRVVALAKEPNLKGTDRVILTWPKAKFYEQTYKQVLDVSYATHYAGMWARLNPNESPSNKAIIGTKGPNKKLSLAQLAQCSDASVGISPIGITPAGAYGAMNGLNSSKNTGKNQSLRRRMADFVLLSVNGSLGDLVSQLTRPDTKQKAQVRLAKFLGGLADQGLIGDSNGGDAFVLKIDSTNNTQNTILGRQLNIYMKVVLFSPADYIIVKGSVGFDGVNLTAII